MAAPCDRLLGRRGRDAHLRLGSRRRRRVPRRLPGRSRLGTRHHSLRRSRRRARRPEPARPPASCSPSASSSPRSEIRRCGTSTRMSTARPISSGIWSSVRSISRRRTSCRCGNDSAVRSTPRTPYTAIRLSFDRLAGDLSVAPFRVTAGAVFDLVTPDPNDPDVPPTTDMTSVTMGYDTATGRSRAADAHGHDRPAPGRAARAGRHRATSVRGSRRSTGSAAIRPPRSSPPGPSRRY